MAQGMSSLNRAVCGTNSDTTGTRIYQWDAENRLVSVSEGSTELASFQYEANGIRTRKVVGTVTTDYARGGSTVVEERSSASGVTRYFHGPGIDNLLASQGPTGVSYPTQDHLGSVREITDTVGNVVTRCGYDPWGNSTAPSGYAYAGREWDPEAGLYYYRARYYDPVLVLCLSRKMTAPKLC